MSVPPGMGAGRWGRTTGIICQEDTRQKEVVWGSLLAAVVSEHRLGTSQGFGPCSSLLSRSQSNPEGLRLERRI